ncbi:hypothetical protein HK096_002118, partial [Nowakowskiella sp. JEL0078]
MLVNLPIEILQKTAKLLSFTDSYRIKRTSKFFFSSIRWNHFDPNQDELFQKQHRVFRYISPIQNAARYGAVEPFELMLADGRFSICRIFKIMLVTKEVNMHIVELLIADPRIDSSKDLEFALQWASTHGHVELFKVILKDSRVYPSSNYNAALFSACENGHCEILKLLFADSNLNLFAHDNYNSCLQLASENGHAQVVRLLLDDGRFDPSQNFNSALRLASKNGWSEVVGELLTDKRVNPAAEDYIALLVAAKSGYVEIVNQLLSDERINRDSPRFILAVCDSFSKQNGSNVEILKLLVDSVSPVFKTYLLRAACKVGNTEAVRQILLEDQLNPTLDNYSLLQQAYENGQVDILSLLLSDKRVNHKLVKF